MKKILFCFVIFILVSGIAAARTSIAVEGNYWFGDSLSEMIGGGGRNYAFAHNSLSLAASADLVPGFVLSADYISSSLINPVGEDGQEVTFPAGDNYSAHQRLSSVFAGYPLTPRPDLKLTVCLGWGYYHKGEQYKGESAEINSDVTASLPQVGAAAQFHLTPQLSFGVTAAAFCGTKAEAKTTWSSGQTNTKIAFHLRRWQLRANTSCIRALKSWLAGESWISRTIMA